MPTAPPPLLQQTSLSLFPTSSPSFSRANSLTSGPSPTAPLFSRQLTTTPSSTRPPPLLSTPSMSIAGLSSDWRANVSIEDRLAQRAKIFDAYSRACSESYEQLLDVVVAVEEELVFAAAVGRMEYLRSVIDWEGRLRMKKGQLGMDKPATTQHTHNAQHTKSHHRMMSRPDDGEDAAQPAAAKRAREEPAERKEEAGNEKGEEAREEKTADEADPSSQQAKKHKT